MLFNVIGYDNQVIGQVEASDAIEAWSEAGKKFENVLDVREVGEPEHEETMQPQVIPKYIKEFRSNLRYAYRNSALNMLGRADWKNLAPNEIERVLSYLLETYYPIRPYPPGSYEQITKDEFMSIFRDTFKDEIRKMKGGS